MDVWIARLSLTARKLAERAGCAERLRSDEGVVALEAFFSVMLVLATTLMFWSGAVLLHNQAVVQGATQLAAQESIMAYDRSNYRDVRGGQAQITGTAQAVYAESAKGLLDDPFKTSRPVAQGFQVSFACAATYPNQGGSFSPGNCGSGTGGRVEQIDVQGNAPTGAWVLDFINGVAAQKRDYVLSGHGVAYSAGPCSSVDINRGVSTC
jgi:hypothetical protein